MWRFVVIVYLAGYKTIENIHKEPTDDIWLLSSFFEHKSGRFGNYVYQDKHILDSGAFSTFKNPEKARSFDWDNYVKKYIAFIKLTKQKLFFELDIDCVVGLEKVEYYRKQIEDAVGTQPIPVWHSNRGWNYFEMMCENYPYVSIGSGRYNTENYVSVLNKFIGVAHKNNCKIHGLGFTKTPLLHKLNFDSVDSTTWLCGIRGGHLYQFNNGIIKQVHKPKGTRAKYKQVHLFNFNEWLKFQKYAQTNL